MKNLPIWLEELHRQWQVARGNDLATRSRPFSRDWTKLLDDAGIRRAEDIKTAERELLFFEKQKRLLLKRHQYRSYHIKRIILPLVAEPWLRGLFHSVPAKCLLENSLVHLRQAAEWQHGSQEERWQEWCSLIEDAFTQGKNYRPFFWRSPESVRDILKLIYELTSRNWKEGTLIREASVEICSDSKKLENKLRVVESALTSFYDQETSIESLGIIGSESRVQFAGKITIHFEDGSSESITKLQASYHLTSDLDRATHITTPAKRLLTVENSKTTLRRLASLNQQGDTLLVACSFPTRGIKRLLELLPKELSLFHFGDTDPAGFHILSKLRSIAPSPVTPFLMHRRIRESRIELKSYDKSLLSGLLEDPLLEDIRTILREIKLSADKGDFEQESLGIPELQGWPFYEVANFSS